MGRKTRGRGTKTGGESGLQRHADSQERGAGEAQGIEFLGSTRPALGGLAWVSRRAPELRGAGALDRRIQANPRRCRERIL